MGHGSIQGQERLEADRARKSPKVDVGRALTPIRGGPTKPGAVHNALGKEVHYHEWDVTRYVDETGIFHDAIGDLAGEPRQDAPKDSARNRGYSSSDVEDATDELARRICVQIKEMGRHEERVRFADRPSLPSSATGACLGGTTQTHRV